MEHDTAGDPITGLKWTRRTTEKVVDELRTLGIDVCASTVAKLLKGLQFRLRVNHKKLARGSAATRAERDAQFTYIAAQRETFARAGWPVISIDAKKRELVGNFKNAGTAWSRQPVLRPRLPFRRRGHRDPLRGLRRRRQPRFAVRRHQPQHRRVRRRQPGLLVDLRRPPPLPPGHPAARRRRQLQRSQQPPVQTRPPTPPRRPARPHRHHLPLLPAPRPRPSGQTQDEELRRQTQRTQILATTHQADH